MKRWRLVVSPGWRRKLWSRLYWRGQSSRRRRGTVRLGGLRDRGRGVLESNPDGHVNRGPGPRQSYKRNQTQRGPGVIEDSRRDGVWVTSGSGSRWDRRRDCQRLDLWKRYGASPAIWNHTVLAADRHLCSWSDRRRDCGWCGARTRQRYRRGQTVPRSFRWWTWATSARC